MDKENKCNISFSCWAMSYKHKECKFYTNKKGSEDCLHCSNLNECHSIPAIKDAINNEN